MSEEVKNDILENEEYKDDFFYPFHNEEEFDDAPEDDPDKMAVRRRWREEAEVIKFCEPYSSPVINDDTAIAHYGTPRHSGRYPWGSGENPYQSMKTFQSTVKTLKDKGMTESQIAKHLQLKNTAQLRARVSQNKAAARTYEQDLARKLHDKGMSNIAIAKRMFGDPKKESTVRNLLDEGMAQRNSVQKATVDILKSELESTPYLQVGKGVELYLGVSDTRLKTALAQLQDEGYRVHGKIQVEQLGTANGQKTTIKVLTKGDVSDRDIYNHLDEIAIPNAHRTDRGETFKKIEPPVSVDSKRIQICYAEAGGSDKDGVIELRRGVDDISLGKANYAQVRIAVDGTHYLKGMAMYADDLPDGIDIRFNTNKHEGTPMIGPKDNSVLKPMKQDNPANPFGASIKTAEKLVLAQKYYTDDSGNEKQSAINIVNEEGNWNDWSRKISAQMLSKQPPALAKRQLDLTYALKREELNDILSLTNPTVKKKLLQDFADACDAAAVHLKAQGFPGQSSKVILPVDTMPENQIYAPSYDHGSEVVLIRYPHAGIFEIPSLTVNNKHPDARKALGQAIDAVGINSKVAQHLSGADFDGDTVLVIPNPKGDIRNAKYFDELKNFEPKEAYRGYPGMVKMTAKQKGRQMGEVTNLITDMTLQNAPAKDIIMAVKHSMVVIDAEKHGLDWRRSEVDNHIVELRQKYQKKDNGGFGGASSLISRASSEERVDHRKDNYRIDPDTGKKIYEYTGETYRKPVKNSNGEIVGWKEVKRQIKSTKMAEAEDARSLISSANTQIERIYANYANQMKAMANEARKAMIFTPNLKYDPEARRVYAQEVESLNRKLKAAKMNKPLERQAQILANVAVKQYKSEHPEIESDADALKKLKGRTLNEMRTRTGAVKNRVKFTDSEWHAVQAGAISESFLKQLLDNADSKEVKQLSMPRSSKGLSAGKKAKARNMLSNGYTQQEVAAALDISTSTLTELLK